MSNINITQNSNQNSHDKITKIGIITNTYPPVRNGVSMAVYGLEQSLKSKGIEVFIATPFVEGMPSGDHICLLPSADIPSTISADLKLPRNYIKTCRKFFKDNQVELIHTHDILFGGIEGAFIAEEMGIPCVHTFHTMIEHYNTVTFPAYKSIIRQAIREVCNSHNHIIAPSQKVYDYLLDLGITSPISQIYNVPYLSLENNSPENNDSKISNRFENQVENNNFVFLTFCRLSNEKGVETGIQTLAPILKNNPKAKYVIAGDGPQKQILVDLCVSLGVENQVIFVGAYIPSELENLIKTVNAKVFLFTSMSENLPTNILEAMYFGLPVVAADDSSVDYVVKDGHNGYKQPENNLTNICQNLINNPNLLQTISINAKATADDFISQDIGQKHLNLYQNVSDIYNSDKDEVGYRQFRLGSIFEMVSDLANKIKSSLKK